MEINGLTSANKESPLSADEEKASVLRYVSKSLISKEKVVFLFGAGASIPCGIFGSDALKSRLWENSFSPRPLEQIVASAKKAGLDLQADKDIILQETTFEQLMTIACELAGGTTQEEKESKIAAWLYKVIPDIRAPTSQVRYFPSFAYEFVCHLMNNELSKHVISMNFDEILDKVIDDELGRGKCSKVVTLEDFELLFVTPNWENTVASHFLIKPHGTRSMRRSCRYRTENVNRFEKEKEKILQDVLDSSLLILVGYEASDPDFRNMVADLGLDNIKTIIVVKNNPDQAMKNLGGPSTKVRPYRGRDEDFFKGLADALYGPGGSGDDYNKFYTKATRHFIRALVYKQLNPIDDIRRRRQEDKMQNPTFFERLNLLIEVLIYCFKVRGLFTGRGLSTCSRIASALDDYVAKDKKKENPIEEVLRLLERKHLNGVPLLQHREISHFESWYFLPRNTIKNQKDLFEDAAQIAAQVLAKELETFFDNAEHKDRFAQDLTHLLARLPHDFDYDLSHEKSLYFLPLKNVQPIGHRHEFRERTEEVANQAKTWDVLYVMSPSVAEWMSEWGKNLAASCRTVKIIINGEVYDIDSLHLQHISNKLAGFPLGWNIRVAKGVKYGLTMTFKDDGNKISGMAILFLRDGKASAYSPIFLKEENAVKNGSDTQKLRTYFDNMFMSGKALPGEQDRVS